MTVQKIIKLLNNRIADFGMPPIKVTIRDLSVVLDGLNGRYSFTNYFIEMDKSLDYQDLIVVLIHEFGHALYHKLNPKCLDDSFNKIERMADVCGWLIILRLNIKDELKKAYMYNTYMKYKNQTFGKDLRCMILKK